MFDFRAFLHVRRTETDNALKQFYLYKVVNKEILGMA